MKTMMTHIEPKKRSLPRTLLTLALALGTLTCAVTIDAAKPPPQVPCQAESVYPVDVFPDGPPLNALISNVPGMVVGGGSGIAWDEHWEAIVRMTDTFGEITYPMGVAGVYVSFIPNAAGQIAFVQVKCQAGPPGGPWPWHDTDPIPVANQPLLDLVNGFTLQIRMDNIPVYVHATYKERSPRVGVAGYMTLGDLVISPRL